MIKLKGNDEQELQLDAPIRWKIYFLYITLLLIIFHIYIYIYIYRQGRTEETPITIWNMNQYLGVLELKVFKNFFFFISIFNFKIYKGK